jgi:hypothetical protein
VFQDNHTYGPQGQLYLFSFAIIKKPQSAKVTYESTLKDTFEFILGKNMAETDN